MPPFFGPVSAVLSLKSNIGSGLVFGGQVTIGGHPLGAVYRDVVSRWRKAIAEASEIPALMIGQPFLEEMIAHRGLALQIVSEQGLDDRDRLGRFVLFRGPQFVNVYIGAFATWAASETGSFTDWIGEYAPYSSIPELTKWLEERGISVERLKPPDANVLTTLSRAYAYDPSSERNPKAEVLIWAEAQQLTRLGNELAANRRALFVSADRRLRRLAMGAGFGEVGSTIISHLGLVQLVDLLIGAEADPRSLSRLLWGVHALDDKEAMRDYLTQLALNRMDEVVTLSLPEILDKVVDRASARVKNERINLVDERTAAESARNMVFMDKVTDEFYQAMNEAVEKRKAEDAQLREEAAGRARTEKEARRSGSEVKPRRPRKGRGGFR